MLGKGPPRKGVSGPAARGGKDLDWQWEQRGQGPPGLVAVTGASGIIKSSKGNIFSLPAPAPAKNFAGACQSICLRRQRYQGYDTPRNRQHVPWSASANPPKHYIMQIVCPVRLGDLVQRGARRESSKTRRVSVVVLRTAWRQPSKLGSWGFT